PFERIRGDLDMWIRLEDLARLDRVLRQHGFFPEVPASRFRWHEELRQKALTVQRLLPRGRGAYAMNAGIVVDAHWTPVYEYGEFQVGFDLEAIWNLAMPSPGAPWERTLPLPIHYLFCAAHAMTMHSTKLIHWADILRLEKALGEDVPDPMTSAWIQADLPSR